MINREDMLELTRRMNLSRNCFDRLAGCYVDEEGYVDGTFNTNFRALKSSEQAKNMALAKTVPFSRTNEQLTELAFSKEQRRPGGLWQLLYGMTDSGLKNDALLETFYEIMTEQYPAGKDYAIYVFHGTYDIPRKSSDGEEQWESEEIYNFIIGVFCPLAGEYEPAAPEAGFLFPGFSGRSGDPSKAFLYEADPERPVLRGVLKKLLP